MGLQFANLIAGAIVVENVFVLPGLGRLMLQSIANRDLPVVENCVMLVGGLVIGAQLRWSTSPAPRSIRGCRRADA